MSLDYSYTLGYGFFITREDLDKAGVEDSDNAVADDADDVFQAIHNGDLLTAEYADSGDDDRAFIAVARSLATGDAKVPQHTDDSPATYQDMSEFATQEELNALDAFAEKCGIEFLIPQVHFYICVT